MKNKLNFKSILFAIALLFSPNLTLSGTMDDLNTVNKILVAFQKNDIEKAEQLAQEIDDVTLQSVWAVNVVLQYLELEDLNSALEVLNLVQDQSLKDIWLANIVLRSLQQDNCEVASAASEQIIDSSLSTIYKMNVDQKCSSIVSVVSSAVSVVSNLLNQTSEVADDSSADVAAVDDESVLSSASSVLSSASSVVSNLFDKSSEGADDSSAVATAVDDELESSSNVALSGEGFEWICTSRDKDGRAPYAIAIEDKNTSKFQISKAVFSTMEECTTVLSQPIEILDGKKFFCSSRDSDGLRPFAAFHWNVENNNLDKLLLINGSAQKCMDSLMNVSVRDGITYVCASRDKDGLAPYSKFQISENPDPVGNKHSSIEGCIKTE